MRYLQPEMARVLQDEHKMVLLAGPRQVGKTTLVKALLKQFKADQQYFNWDIDSHRKKILKQPETFWKDAQSPERPYLALDEIHKYPRWKRLLKGLYDAVGQDLRILVTGSGRLDIYQRGGDSLFGRYYLFHLNPFSLAELLRSDRHSFIPPQAVVPSMLDRPGTAAGQKALEQLETLNGFPEPVLSGKSSTLVRWQKQHRHLLIREDLRDLTRIQDLGLLENLMMLLPERIGSPLSVNALREDLQVAYGTVKNWLAALERLYYLFEIRPFSGKLNRTLHKEAKIYLYDWSDIDEPGARFENLMALHLKKACDAWNDWGCGDYRLWYVRDKEKRETDFLITEKNKPWLLVEVKLSDSNISPQLTYFKDRLKVPLAFQVVRQVSPAYLMKYAPGTYVISAVRLLESFC